MVTAHYLEFLKIVVIYSLFTLFPYTVTFVLER